jgi:hypothetical protein
MSSIQKITTIDTKMNKTTKDSYGSIYDDDNLLRIEKENEVLLLKLKNLENQTIPQHLSELKSLNLN